MTETTSGGAEDVADSRGWYEVVQGEVVLQGDLLAGFPVPRIVDGASWPIQPGAVLKAEFQISDVVVLTQSCDLENDKIDDILLAQTIPWPDAVNSEVARGNMVVKSKRFREALVAGNVPNFALLHNREQPPGLPWSVVSFSRLFTAPKAFLVRFAADAGPRLRLRSPYREHLAQAFSRFFMRVGLPHDAKGFLSEGEIASKGGG